MERMDAGMVRKMFLAGARALEAKKEYINELNVFPVPDGDTGTNMTMTVMATAKEVSQMENPGMDELGKAISGGSLRGARGNSGVILSQIFRGFIKSVQGNDELDVTILGNAVIHASETAYKAVMKPKEGTILTVTRAGAEKARELLIEGTVTDIVEFCDLVSGNMEEALLQTPHLLPVLKQAGVVDSGGEGLMAFVRGAIDALNGRIADFTIKVGGNATVVKAGAAEEADIPFGYCTEFIIMLERNGSSVEVQLKEYLQKLGDGVVVVSDDDIVKVHVHTNDPGLAIQKALTYGALTSIKIDNMREEHHEKVIHDKEKAAAENRDIQEKEQQMPKKETGFVAVSSGEGLADIFKDLGVDLVVEGGQTMNPSTEDILDAVEKVNADAVFILPNNSNIILAAKQAGDMIEDKDIYVIPSKNIPQGITAMINYMAGRENEENSRCMTEEMERIRCGQVTYAVRDTNMDGQEIKKGDFIGLTDKKLIAVSESAGGAAKQLAETLLDASSELVSLYYGEGVSEEDAEALADAILAAHEGIEVEVQYGGQPVYCYFISVE